MVLYAKAVHTILGMRSHAHDAANSASAFIAHQSMVFMNPFVIHASAQTSSLIALHVIN
jgi:hypothetical protein